MKTANVWEARSGSAFCVAGGPDQRRGSMRKRRAVWSGALRGLGSVKVRVKWPVVGSDAAAVAAMEIAARAMTNAGCMRAFNEYGRKDDERTKSPLPGEFVKLGTNAIHLI